MTSTSPLRRLRGYQLAEQIYESSHTLVYRGTRKTDEKSVIIKFLRSEYPTFSELVQFRNQYAIAKNLDIEGIIKSYALERYENRYALIMEDIGGISLAEYEGRSSFSLAQFLDIAIQLSGILHQLHNNSIIHKDIKPANILIHPESKQVKLIDFSISTLLPKETQTLQTPNVLEGTLAYLSPEQTGRMNRGIDYRSDFYSLGVTFYELLTGELPFQVDDPMELIHCHIAKAPTFPHTQHPIPQPLSGLVMKLMAKNAEDRYQSALGLKYDLEKCLSQWQETGTIEPFELGARDICDRFNIPEKLYGRDNEVKILLEAFNRVAEGQSEMMLVAGFSGIGKTAVVNEVHKPIVKQRGYFIKGKFDQFNRNIPFSAFVQAFRSLMGQILSESDAQLQKWKTKILAAVGNNGQVLIDAIPSLELVIGEQPAVPELSGSAAQNRFNLLFEKFIAVFTTKNHPLTIFLDDLQWADSASLNLMKVLMGNQQTGYLLLLGAYRDNEVFPAHPLMLSLEALTKRCDPASAEDARECAPREQEATISTITLAPLSQHYINQLVAETLSCQAQKAQPLTELVYKKTKGNPFFTTQFLKGLYEDNLIVFNPHLGYWECDLVRVRDAALTDDVVEFMAGRLQKLPVVTQEVLKLAACIGNQFDLETLAIVRENSSEEVASELWSALQEGTIFPISESYKFFQGEIDSAEAETVAVNYRFLHDRVQQAAYSLIPQERKKTTHLDIGRLLSKNISPEQQDINIFKIVNHWNQGIELIADSTEREHVIQLNLRAGEKAKSSAAYTAALKYFQTALSLLDLGSWQTNYLLTLKLHESKAEVAYLTGDFELMETTIEQVTDRSSDFLDLLKVKEIQIQAKMAQTQHLSALNIGINFLALLGIEVPESPQVEDLQVELAAISKEMEGKAIATLADLPLIEDRNQLAKVKILESLLPTCYQAKPSLFPWVVCKLMQLSIQHGNTVRSAHIYSCYGIVCILILQDVTSAQEYGKLACHLDLNPKTGNGVNGTFATGACIAHYSVHAKQSLPLLLNAYQAGLETGNFQYAGMGISYRSQYLYLIGHNLSALKREMTTASHALATMKQEHTLAWIRAFEQAILNLLGESENPWELIGKAYNEKKSLPLQIAANDRMALHCIYLNRLILCYLFERIPQAVENAALAESYLDGVICLLDEYAWNFYDSLTQLARYSDVEISMQKSILEKVETNQKKIQCWATHTPINGQHKYDLVVAERHRILGERLEAMEFYDRAIAGAKENEYIQEEALANELAAKFYLDWGKETIAEAYLQQAYYCYAQWGAKAKTDALEQRYPELLKPILQSDRKSFSSGISISRITSTSHSQTSTVTNISSILDFSSLLKASQTLSGEIELDRLLSTLMKIILENAGATKGALLLTSETGLTVKAIATRDNEELQLNSVHQSILLEDYQDLPSGLINYVRRTTQTTLLDTQTAQTQFATDNYLLRFSPQSLLCLPLLERGNLIGILYLENTIAANAFTSDRVEILDALCAQAAISLTNARLYQQAQQALQDLQEAQLQLVQNEKMATLGNLVAGVAHEINNPVGFIGGNVDAAQEYLQDLLYALELYQQKSPSSDAELAEELEDLDLEFITEDFPKLIASMRTGCDRIRNISTSLRTFSRTDTNAKTEFNLHEGLESTLLILKYRLKANEHRPAIEIFKQYGNLPEMKCYAGQLNQVFMNLVANAIDALDESNEGKTFAEIERAPNRITIATDFVPSKNSVRVRIADNGTGMPEEAIAKIFEQGFTTKGVGKGTGLGLAIAHQIITEKHGGEIVCHSELQKGTEFIISLPLNF